MMDPTRLDILMVLAKLCEILPPLRFGQLVCNVATFADPRPGDVWTVEDGPFLAEAERFLTSQLERLELPEPTFLAGSLQRAPERVGNDPADPGGLDPESNRSRLPLLLALRDYADRSPGPRFTQLVADLVARFKSPSSPADWSGTIWDIEDEELLATLLDRPRHHLATAREIAGSPTGHPTPTNAP